MGMVLTLYRISIEKLREIENNTELLEELVDNEDTDSNLYIDKSWQGVHYLLTGEAIEGKSELDEVIMSGEILGGYENEEEFDMGYGSPLYILPIKVKKINEILSTINMNDVEKRCNAKSLAKLAIYPFGIDDEDKITNIDLDYFKSHLNNVIAFYQIAANNNEVVLRVMS